VHAYRLNGMSKPFNFLANSVGVLSFVCFRPTSTGAVRSLSLNCTDASCRPTTHSVDCTSEDTFKPQVPVNGP
jgi:hypothetical protein